MKPNRQAGLSLLELVFALGIFITVAGGLSEILVTTAGTYGTGMKIATLDGDARRVVDRAAEELIGAGITTLVPAPAPPFGAGTVTFQKGKGFAGGAVVWGPVCRFDLRPSETDPDDGADNDGDGFVDEMELWLVRDVGAAAETEQLLVRGVSEWLEGEDANGIDDNGNGLVDEPGFSVVLEGTILTVRLSLHGRDARGRKLLRTVETTVVARN